MCKHTLHCCKLLINFQSSKMLILTNLLVFLKIFSYWLIFEKEGVRRNIDLFFHLVVHSLVDSLCALTENRTCNRGIWGWRSNQLSCQARATNLLLFSLVLWEKEFSEVLTLLYCCLDSSVLNSAFKTFYFIVLKYWVYHLCIKKWSKAETF